MATAASSAHKPAPRSAPGPQWQVLAPGIVASAAIMVAANWAGEWVGALVLRLQGIDPTRAGSPISGIMMAILIGLIVRNTAGMPPWLKPGVAFCTKTVLRLGIILLGIRLSLFDALKLGAWGIPIVTLTVATGLWFTTWLTRRLQQPERLGTLIAASTSICGVTAVVSTAAGIGADDDEMAYAIATVTIFGLVAMLVYPYLAHWLFAGDPLRAGLFMGTAIHETSQVAGAALIYGQVYDSPRAIDVATVTKLLRNVFLVGVVPLLSILYMRRAAASGQGFAGRRATWMQLFPLFILGFLGMAVVRTIGDAGVGGGGQALGLMSAGTWKAFYTTVNQVGSTYLLGTAMAGVGLSTAFSVFQGIGWKPVLIGLSSAVVVGAVSAAAALAFGAFM